MRMFSTIVALCFLLAPAQPVQAQEYEPITGAFGWTLGELPPQQTLDMLPDKPDFLSDGLAVYREIWPPNPVDFFIDYQIQVAPGSGEVVEIFASDNYLASLEEAAREDFAKLKSILEGKYGPSCCELPQDWIASGYVDTYQAERDGKSVCAYLREFPAKDDWPWQIYIEYVHWPLKERLKAEDTAKEADAL